MTPQFSNLVDPVITYALDLKDRLDRGEEDADLEAEQRELLNRLTSEAEGRRQTDFAGDGQNYLGVRYALACWLDELFIVHSPWSDRWNDRKLEVALYGTNDRAWKFWDQADLVLRRPTAPRVIHNPGLDAIEAFFLCVVLGFRGKHLSSPAKVREYVDDMRTQVGRTPSWQSPRDSGVETNVEPLTGRDSLRRTVLVLGALALGITLLFLVIYRLINS